MSAKGNVLVKRSVRVMSCCGLESGKRGTVVQVFARNSVGQVDGLSTRNGAVALIREDDTGRMFSMFTRLLEVIA